MKCRVPPGCIGNTTTPVRARVEFEARALEIVQWCERRGAHVVVEIAADEPEWLDELALIGEPSPGGPKSRVERRLLKKRLRKKRKPRPR